MSDDTRALLRRRAGWPAWGVLGACLVFVALLDLGIRRTRTEEAAARFELHVRQAVSAIEQRMLDHAQVLRAGAGLVEASQRVDRGEWHRFVSRLQLDKSYPGIQGVGFSAPVDANALAAHEQTVRDEGFPEYSVRPAGRRDRYTAIIYLEPFSGRNLAAFGFDMYSEPVRRQAMDRALADADIALSGKVRLVQETHGREQAGFLMYLPVFRGPPPVDRTRRWQALQGFVYSPFRAEDLMRGILGDNASLLDIAIYDGTSVAAEALLFRSSESPARIPRHSTTRRLSINGRAWTLVLRERDEFAAGLSTTFDWLVPVLGLGLAFALFGLTVSLLNRREQALAIAAVMSARHAASDERFRQLFMHIGQGVVIHRNDGSVVDANPAAQTLLAPAGEVGGAALFDEQGQPLPPARHPVAIAVSAGHAVTGVVVELRDPSADVSRWLSIDAYPHVENGERAEQRVYEVISDITERRRVERLKSEFVSTVSHELRTPLTSIRGALGLLRGGVLGVTLPKPAEDMLEIAGANTERLLLLINDILDIQKIEAGQMTFRFASLPLRPFLQGVMQELTAYVEQFGVALSLLDDGSDAQVRADSARLGQVIGNLVSNAAKFSPHGGAVEVSMTVDADRVRITVADRGPGVPLAFRPRLFERFSQADASDSRAKGGTGLGLAISKAIAEKHGGSLGFADREGGGSCFHLDLPRVDSSAEPSVSATRPPSRNPP